MRKAQCGVQKGWEGRDGEAKEAGKSGPLTAMQKERDLSQTCHALTVQPRARVPQTGRSTEAGRRQELQSMKTTWGCPGQPAASNGAKGCWTVEMIETNHPPDCAEG